MATMIVGKTESFRFSVCAPANPVFGFQNNNRQTCLEKTPGRCEPRRASPNYHNVRVGRFASKELAWHRCRCHST